MTLRELKTGLFGYRRVDVCRYITQLEEEFSARLEAREQEAAQTEERYRQRVQALEEELAELRRSADVHRDEQLAVAGALLEAQRCADQLRGQAERERQKAREELSRELEMDNRRLESYRGRIEQLRAALQAAVEEFDRNAGELAAQIGEVAESNPEQNLSLFRRRPEQAE